MWNDSVWSKVIAAGITAALAAVGGLAFARRDTLGDLAAVLTRPVPVPLWLLLVLALAFAALAALRRSRSSDAGDHAQPNAIPIARIDTPFLERPFEALSAEQQRFLAQQFRREARVFTPPSEVKDAGWFEELARWHYIGRQADDSSRYEITVAGWQELERVRSEAGMPGR
ncbi:MAG: hypothetical protein ACHQPH_16785 [Reyranellales bacterium]